MKAVKYRELLTVPSRPLSHSVEITDKSGNKVKCPDPRVVRSLILLMDLHSVNGGAASHWGGPSAFAEINSALFTIMLADRKTPWYERYNFVNDPGHTENGVYAIRAILGFSDITFDDLKGFRSSTSKLTGHGEAHLNPEGVFLSNGPLGSSLAQAEGLAIADKLNGNNRITVVNLSDGASMEGEAKEAFASIPGLMAKGKLNPFLMIVSDNNTKLSGRIDKDSYPMAPTFDSLEKLGWEVRRVKNGHDLEAVYNEIESSISSLNKEASRPIALILKTVKGYGIKATEEAASGGHGFPLKAYDEKIIAFIDEIWGGKTPDFFANWAKSLTEKKSTSSSGSSAPKEKVQIGVSSAMIRAAKEGYPVYSISSDVQGSTGVQKFQKEFSDKFIDVGVAESNMVSIAVGLSKMGFIPVVDTFAAFGVTKGNLPLIMSSLSNTSMIAVFSHTGFQDAADGASHQSTTYISAVSSIPNVKVVVLASSKDAEEYIYKAIVDISNLYKTGEHRSYVFFLGREDYAKNYGDKIGYELFKPQVLKEGKDLLIAAIGPMVELALEAHDRLQEKGVHATIINNLFVNEKDVTSIAQKLKESSSRLLTVEDHQLQCGMGAQLVHALKLKGEEFKLSSIAIDGKFGRSAYTAREMYKLYKMDCDSIVEAALRLSDRN